MLEPQRQHLLSLYRPWTWRSKWWAQAPWDCATTAFILRATGRSDPLFLQIKEEPASAYAPYLPDAHPAHHNGQRVAEGQRAMQLQSDPFLGWTHMGGRDYLVRQLNDHKGSIEIEDLAGGGLCAFAESLRRAAGAGARPQRGPAGDCRVPGLREQLCRGTGAVWLALRGPDGEGLAGAAPLRQGKAEALDLARTTDGAQLWQRAEACCLPR